MKEIKFRVWSNEYHKYLTPYGYPNGHSDLWINCIDGKLYDIQGSYSYDEGVGIDDRQVLNVVLEQYTGLKDIKKREVYENDKCLFNGRKKGIVRIIGGMWIVEDINQHFTCFLYRAKELEIIGNIHEDNK